MQGLASNKFLVPVSGPPLPALQLSTKPSGQSIGRNQACDIKLPSNAELVSRMHAQIVADNKAKSWFVSDLGSRWGTWVNGVRLQPNQRLPLRESDLIAIAPWTFRFCSTQSRPAAAMSNDVGQTQLRTFTANPGIQLNTKMLELLMEAITSFQAAADESQLDKLLIDTALAGTRLQNAFVLRPVDMDGSVEVVMSRFADPKHASIASYSRSLIKAAAAGQVVELARQSNDMSQSIVQMQITAAICIPIMLDSSLSQYLYLDAREGAMGSLPANAAAFCVTLGRIASLAFSHLKRVDIQKRQADMHRDLAAAAAAQKWILPKRISHFGPFTCIGESRAGQYIGGDFFDLILLAGNRIAVALGDVSGKGVAASVLMTATQGFLHAAMEEHGDPAKAITSLNQYVSLRSDDSRFVTLWLAVLDPGEKTLTYVNAGHGYSILQDAQQELRKLDGGDGVPVGLDADVNYIAQTVPLPEQGRILIVSDGIIEQYGFGTCDGETSQAQQFGLEGVIRAMESINTKADLVAELFATVERHAHVHQLADDATSVCISW